MLRQVSTLTLLVLWLLAAGCAPKQADVVGALEEHLHQVGSCGATTVQQGLQESLPLIRKGVGQEISSIGLGDSPQRTAGWKRSLSIAGIRNSLAISTPLLNQ